MAHELSSTWTSKVFDENTQEYVDDPWRNFDLRDMEPNGDARRCTQDGRPLTGRALAARPDPYGYDVKLDHVNEEVHHHGVALRDSAGQIIRIVGVARFPLEDARKGKFLTDQDEATWVATKP